MKKTLILLTAVISISVSAQITIGNKTNHVFVNQHAIRSGNYNPRNLININIIPTDKGPALSVSAGNGAINFRKSIPLSKQAKDTVKVKRPNNIYD